MGVSGRCEAAIHSARRYLETLPPDHVFVKLDFSNAFIVADRIPDLYAFCYSAYHLSCSMVLIWSFPKRAPNSGIR